MKSASSSHRWGTLGSRKRSWEESGDTRAWGTDDDDLPDFAGDSDRASDEEGEEDDDELWSAERCGQELLSMLISTYMEGGMAALYVVQLATVQ